MAVLTNFKARSINPESKPLPHGGVVGLVLIPSHTTGKGKWVLRYTSPVTRKRRNAGLGAFPEVSVAEAGRLGSEFWAKLKTGEDPLELKLDVARQNTVIPTFFQAAHIRHGELIDGWANKKHGKDWINSLTQYAFPAIGCIPINKITPNDIAATLRPIWLKIPETAGRVKQRLHSVFSWAWAQGYCESNPVDVVIHLLPKQPELSVRRKHMRSMPWEDVPNFISRHLHNAVRQDISRLMLEFLILTAARSGEVRGMRWSEVDWVDKVWIIPSERMKAHKQHRVPLAQQALHILDKLKGLHDELVFPSPVKQTVLSDMALTQLIRGIYENNYPNLEIPTAHGFRSSFRDWCSENGYERDLAERALAHTIKNQVEAAYHRTDLLEKRRSLMQDWADFVSGVLIKDSHEVESICMETEDTALNTEILEPLSISQLMNILDASNRDTVFDLETQLALQLLVLTGVDIKSLLGMRWSEFLWEERLWVIPAERSEFGKENCIPLVDEVLHRLVILSQGNDGDTVFECIAQDIEEQLIHIYDQRFRDQIPPQLDTLSNILAEQYKTSPEYKEVIGIAIPHPHTVEREELSKTKRLIYKRSGLMSAWIKNMHTIGDGLNMLRKPGDNIWFSTMTKAKELVGAQKLEKWLEQRHGVVIKGAKSKAQ